MNLRARIEDKDGFLYPADDSPVKMIEFWSIIEGYRLKGINYDITYSTLIDDMHGNEIFDGDIVTVHFNKTFIAENSDISGLFPNDTEDGWVEFIDGCFVIVNDEGLIWDIGHSFMEDGTFALEIIGNVYDEEMSDVPI